MTFQRIQIKEAHSLIKEKNVNIADIRDAMSYQAGHISGATRVDNDNLQDYMTATSKDAPLLVCCYHGNSSQGAADFFASQGYQEVYSLDGGYEMWKLAVPELCSQ